VSKAADRWAGATAVITGAGSGIGAGLARAAAAAGMTVVLADIDEPAIQALSAELLAKGAVAADPVVTDVSDLESVERLAGAAFGRPEPVRLLANNAGIEQVSLLWEDGPGAWDRLMGINVSGVYHGMRAFVPRLIEEGVDATILSTASVGAFTSGAFQGMYQVSKRAVLTLSECLASDLEVVKAPIQVSVVFPGAVNTQIFHRAPDLGGRSTRMRGTLEDLCATSGMDSDEAGALILERAAAGDRWITTDPGMAWSLAKLLRDRVEEIMGVIGS
jgi:NAD(P)-dependent dehydrogenase (short-subunit alcohol dehydrogenase family)